MKKKKKSFNQKKKARNLLFKFLIVLIIFSVIGIGVYYFLTAEDEESSLTLLEKQWIEKNKTTLISIKVPNNIYVLSYTGDGVLFDFLNEFEENTELSFNKVPYNYPLEDEESSLSFVVLRNNEKIKDTDISIFEDNYILIGNEEGYLSSLSDINGQAVGILKTDLNTITTSNFDINLTLKDYDSIDSLIKAINAKEVSYGCVPRYTYLKQIIDEENKVYVNYNLTNLSNKVVLRLGKDERLNNIIAKSLENWLENDYQEYFDKKLMNFYQAESDITELDKSSLVSRVYRYGFVEDTSYNVLQNDKLYGVAALYLNTLENMLGMEFQYVRYESSKDLEKALENGTVDFAYLNFDYENEKYLNTSSPFAEKMVAISSDYININDKNGLSNNKLYLLEDNYLYDNFKDNYNVKTLNSYLDEVSKDGIIVLDEADYLSLKDTSLKNYKYLFTDTFTGEYKFVVSDKNEVLYNVLNFILNNTNSEEYKVRAINNLLKINSNKTSFKEIYLILLAIILLPIIVILLSIIVIKNSKKLKISRKENFLKYNDILTNLKNRNYLNDNIEKWDDTKIYPRTIVIIDLNNLKYVNDNYGHEEGNELIKQAAAILINTQLEKSEIVRTDGNEFLIYLIGYSKTQISTYISKLSKEFDKLPYGFGAAIGYSIIEDEIKTVDDAINEAVIEMRIDKQQNYK